MSEERACLEFLLAELDRWRRERRIPEHFLTPLIGEYTARWEALIPPRRAIYDLGNDLELPSPPPLPPPRRGLLAFLEERNIAALHLVGSLLLLAGLVLLVQWQWDGIGRFLLLFVLALSAAGLMRLSDTLRDEHPQSAQVLGTLGALIVPLCGIALKVFGLAQALSWPLLALCTALGSGVVYGVRLRTTHEPLLVGLLAAAGAGAVWGLAGLLPSTLFWPTLILGQLGLATLSFWGVQRESSPLDRMRTLSGHLLTLAGIAASFLCVASGDGHTSNAVFGGTLLVAAGLYGITGSRLQLAWLGYAATFTAACGAQFLLPDSASLVARGGILAATGTLAALLSRLTACPEPYQKSATFLTLLGTLSVVLDPHQHDLPLTGLFIATALLWRVASQTPQGLLCVSALSLAAARLVAIPLDSWFVSITHLPANELRWLLLPALGFALWSLRQHEARAVALRQSASATFVWACTGQLEGLWNYGGNRSAAVASGATLLLASLGLGLWGLWQGRPQATRSALVPLGLVTVVQWLAWLNGAPLLPQPILALALALAGGTCTGKSALGSRAALWLLAAGHLSAGLLPTESLPFWGLALVPVLVWLEHHEGESEPTQRLRLTEFFTILSFLAVALLPSGTALLSLSLSGLALVLVPLRRLCPSGVATSAVLTTATITLAASGYPHPHFSLAQTGFLLAALATFWLGLSASMKRATPLWETLSQVALATTGTAVVAALVGMFSLDQGRWTIFTLGLAAVMLAASAGLRRQPNYLHSAFASAFAAFALYFLDQYGLGSDRLDYFLLPVGIYLLYVAERLEQAPLRAPGLLLLLGSSLLATTLNPHAWQHAVLLVLECLLAVGAGIQRRVKVYLGGGIVFLVALLVQKLWDPLREINFGVYLTLLGVGVLAMALQFEKRREALRRWAEAVKETYQSWE